MAYVYINFWNNFTGEDGSSKSIMEIPEGIRMEYGDIVLTHGDTASIRIDNTRRYNFYIKVENGYSLVDDVDYYYTENDKGTTSLLQEGEYQNLSNGSYYVYHDPWNAGNKGNIQFKIFGQDLIPIADNPDTESMVYVEYSGQGLGSKYNATVKQGETILDDSPYTINNGESITIELTPIGYYEFDINSNNSIKDSDGNTYPLTGNEHSLTATIENITNNMTIIVDDTTINTIDTTPIYREVSFNRPNYPPDKYNVYINDILQTTTTLNGFEVYESKEYLQGSQLDIRVEPVDTSKQFPTPYTIELKHTKIDGNYSTQLTSNGKALLGTVVVQDFNMVLGGNSPTLIDVDEPPIEEPLATCKVAYAPELYNQNISLSINDIDIVNGGYVEVDGGSTVTLIISTNSEYEFSRTEFQLTNDYNTTQAVTFSGNVTKVVASMIIQQDTMLNGTIPLTATPTPTVDGYPIVNIYKMTEQELDELQSMRFFMNGIGFSQSLAEYNYGDMVVNIQTFPFDIPTETDNTVQVELGNFRLQDVNGIPIEKSIVDINLGKIDIPIEVGDVNYNNIEMMLYVPYYEPFSIDPKEIIGNTLEITVRINCLNGNGTLNVKNLTTQKNIVHKQAQIGQDIPSTIDGRVIKYLDDNVWLNDSRQPYVKIIKEKPSNEINYIPVEWSESKDGWRYLKVDRAVIESSASEWELERINYLLRKGVIIRPQEETTTSLPPNVTQIN